jgi:FMN phosphatase YigB (HAD superfamily)
MKQKLTEQRNIIIFDCDGVFFSWKLLGGIEKAKDFCAKVKVEVLSHLLPFLSAEEIAVIGRRSYEETGDGLKYFVDIAEKNGMDTAEFREQMYTLYHQVQFRHAREYVPGLLTPCFESSQHLLTLGNHMQFGILSQSCRDHWVKPLLEEKGISCCFQPDNIFGFREFGWNEKSLSAKGLGMIMDAMGADPSRVVFVEDTMANLRPVKESYKEVVTVHLSDWQTASPQDDYIDLCFASNLEFLRALRAAHPAMAPSMQRTPYVLGLHP